MSKTRNLNFKLNNDSKKQFIQESKNAIIKLRQSIWKHVLNKEIKHYFIEVIDDPTLEE